MSERPKGGAAVRTVQCASCRQPFQVPYRLRTRRFCSRACAARVNGPRRRLPVAVPPPLSAERRERAC